MTRRVLLTFTSDICGAAACRRAGRPRQVTASYRLSNRACSTSKTYRSAAPPESIMAGHPRAFVSKHAARHRVPDRTAASVVKRTASRRISPNERIDGSETPRMFAGIKEIGMATQTATVGDGKLETVGGLKIFFRSWRPADRARGVVAIVPGFNSHSGYYGWVAGQFVSRGLAVYAL